MLLLAYFISVFPSFPPHRSILSVFVAYFTKIIPHSKRFSNRLSENSFLFSAKLPGPVLCILPGIRKKQWHSAKRNRALCARARFPLHSVGNYDMIAYEKALHIMAGGWPALPEQGGESYADYFDIPCLRTCDSHQSEKRKPPPWPVTVFYANRSLKP